MNYYPSKCEIYSNLLKKHIVKKIKSTQKNDVFIKKLAHIKLFEALFSPLYTEPTAAKAFIDNLFLRMEAVCNANGKKIKLSVQGEGNFFIDRRLLCYIFLELGANGSEINVKINPLGLIISGSFCTSYHLRLLLKKCCSIKIKGNNAIGIALQSSSIGENTLNNAIESLENPFSPEYLWL